jgi:NADH-quinone oxidoreductase subunit J
MTILFYLSAAVAVIATLAVITRKNAVHALLYLIVSLLAVAVIFFILGAPFVAALEVIVYAGAIMVLFLFAVMMLGAAAPEPEPVRRGHRVRAWAGPVFLSLILLAEFVIVLVSGEGHALSPGSIPPRDVGLSLFSMYVLGVELAGAVLLAALIGAYHVGRRSGHRSASAAEGVPR